MQRSDNAERFALSLNQQNIWNLEQVYGGTSINNISTSIRIQGRLDFVALQETLDRVIAQDPTLRTRLVLENGEVWQYSAPYERELFPVYDFSGAGEDGLAVWEETLAREALPLLQSPLYRFILFRTGEHAGGVYVKIHHIISDGWSQALICNRIARTYFQILSGEEVDLEEAPSYEIHVQEEGDYLASKHYARDRRYWEGMLEEKSEPSVLKEVRSAAISSVGRRLSFKLPQHLNHAIFTFCMQNRVAPFAVFYMALATYFKRIGGADRFTIGVPIFNRTNYKFKQCTGMFVSTLPFISDIDSDWSFRQFNNVLAENWLELLRHQRFPFKEICAMTGSQDDRLFQIALSYQDSKIYESNDASVMFTGRWHYSGYQAEQLCIHLSNLESIREYAVDYDYLTQFFTEKEILDFHTCLMNLLTEGLACPDKPISELSLLSPAEREQVLYTFNRTKRYLERGSVYASVHKVVTAHPERVALICKGQRLTYHALEERAADLSAILSAAQPGKRGLAAVLLPRNFDLFTAMTAAMRAGWAYLVISDETPMMRILTILEQSGADTVFTSRAMAQRLEEKGCSVPAIFVEENQGIYEIEPPASAEPADLAYVVYTSGSTGTPKGVEISQQSLLNLSKAMAEVYDSGAVLSLCNTGFDAFVLESAAALMNGRTIVLPTAEELESPRRLAALIKGYAVGTLVTTPSRLLALLQDRDFKRAMNRIESVVCGGEAFPRELLQQLSVCCDARIYNQYGPSEATVAVSHKLLNRTARITAGTPLQNCRLYVLDKWRNPLPVGVFGELYIGGLCVGKGYRNDPELTADRFLPSPFESGERLYRTGDIACWTEDGEIVLSGRSDKQIKLHGLRVEPQEIISCISAYPGINSVAVRVLDVSGQSVIAVYYTSDHAIPEMELLTYAASYLPRYMVPSFACRLSEIPLTGNGKVDEASLPIPEMATGSSGAPVDRVTAKALSVFTRDLQREIGADDDYFLRGGSSLTAMRTLAELEEELGCTLRVSDLYACRTARRLGECISQRLGIEPEKIPASVCQMIPKAPKQSRYPLTPIQRGIYFQCALDRESILYNMPGVFKLPEGVNIDRLEEAFRRLIADEPMLRTAFVLEQGMVYARVYDDIVFSLQRLDGDSVETVFAAFVRPFDVAKAPLLRAGLWKSGEENYLFLDIHHLIGDGLSTPILMERLDACYRGVSPSLSEISYLDYACYLESRGGAKEEDLLYWKEHLAELPAALVLPADSARGQSFDHHGAKYIADVDRSVSTVVDTFCQERGISVYALFMAAFGILLKEITGKNTFTVGTPVSGRNHAQLQNVCGPLLGVLPVKLAYEGSMTAGEYLAAVAEEINAMLDHGSCSQEELLSVLNLRGELGTNPLYSVTLSMRPFDTDALAIGGGKLELIPIMSDTAKAEMGLEVAKDGESYQLIFEYADALFREETIAFYGRCLSAILSGLMDSEMSLCDLDPMSVSDRIELFDDRDHLWKPYLNLSVHEIARRTAQLHGEDTAVIFHGECVTRAALERRACQMANALVAAGVKKGDKVGLAMSRTPDLFAAMLGILKTGGAYVPLLTSFPENRLSYMVETAGITVILTDAAAVEQLPEDLRDKALVADHDLPDTFRSVAVGPQDLINVLFTSGSTGQPKGVMVRHGSASNLLSNMQDALCGVTGPMMCVTTPVFDIFMTESLLSLAMGRTIILADEEEMLLPYRMAELMERYEAGFIQFTASRLAMCLTNEAFCKAAKSLQFTIVGGEQVSPALVKKFKSCCKGRLVNLYGPTEATVYTTMIDLHEDDDVTIGYPMGNCRVYVMDEEGKRLLPTAQGELYLAGTCVAAGYLGREDLTEKAFLPDPFVPGEMMYRSGDLGRLRVDGRIDCFGRCDKQVKINGQRLELDEIVNVMLNSSLVSQAVIVPVERADGVMTLYAFCVRQDGATGEWSDIADYLKRYLPDYMIPSVFHVLSDIPYTVGGKADLERLKSMAQQKPPVEELPVTEEAVVEEEPAEEKQEGEQLPDLTGPVTEEKILAVWRHVLKGRELQGDKSFFEQGGTSLDTLNVLSLYYNAHWELTIAQFYQNPTARAQAAILGGVAVEELAPVEETVGTEDEPAEQLVMELPEEQDLTLPRYVPVCRWKKAERKTVFLTGVTGFFGAHLLRALLQSGTKQVICLVRGDEQRVFDALSWYFGEGWTNSVKKNVRAICGDLTAPMLGLDRDTYYALAKESDAVYHTAADVRHFVKNEKELLHNNVSATRAMIEFALDANAPLHAMSTLSVCGEHIVDTPEKRCVFTERDFAFGQNWQENVYVRSKMLSEAAVYDAIANRGLQAKVYRLGRLVWRAEDGVFQKNPCDNMTALLSAVIAALGAFPADLAEQPMDMTCVDLAADAVVGLADCRLTTLHVMNSDALHAGDIFVHAIPGLRVLERDEFDSLLAKRMMEEQDGKWALLAEYVRMQRLHSEKITPLNLMTQAAMAAEGIGCTFPDVERMARGLAEVLKKLSD